GLRRGRAERDPAEPGGAARLVGPDALDQRERRLAPFAKLLGAGACVAEQAEQLDLLLELYPRLLGRDRSRHGSLPEIAGGAAGVRPSSIPSRHGDPAGEPASPVGVALLVPGIGFVVIAVPFPESGLIGGGELERAHPLGALPEITAGHDE